MICWWTRAALPYVAAAALTACAAEPNTSYVAKLQRPEDAEVLADSLATFVSQRLPIAASTIILDPTPSDQSGNTLTAPLTAALRRRGFAVAGNRQSGRTDIPHIRYVVTPLDGGELARVTIDASVEASRFFVRNTAGELQAGGPFMVMQVEPGR